MDIDQVLRDYGNGDEDKQINLFLVYRDPREEFSDIKQALDVVQFPEKRILNWLRWIAALPNYIPAGLSTVLFS